jgi:Electron transfer DM13
MKLPWGLRWWELLPEALLGVGLGVFFVTEMSAATSAFKSRTATTLMIVAAMIWVVGRLILVRFTRWPALRLVVFTFAAIAVLWIVVFPAYDNNTVVEALPAIDATSPPNTLPDAPSGASRPRGTKPAAAATEPVARRRSAIHGIDHRASGAVVIYEQPNTAFVVGLEGIDIQPGPDYDVYVVPGADREEIDDGVRLDDLRGNKGTQYYSVPADTDVASGEWTVLVWCQTFDVPVAGATPV